MNSNICMNWKNTDMMWRDSEREDGKMKRISRILTAAIIITLLLGTIVASAGSKDITWKTKKTKNGYVTKFYDDGNYVCKVKSKRKLKVRMCREEELTYDYVTSRKNKFILVEVITGTCTNDQGDGITDCGYYISYKALKYKEGRRYKSYCIYGNNNYCDDVIARFDKRIK